MIGYLKLVKTLSTGAARLPDYDIIIDRALKGYTHHTIVSSTATRAKAVSEAYKEEGFETHISYERNDRLPDDYLVRISW